MVTAFLHRFDELRDRRITTREVDALRLDRTIHHWEPVFARARWLLTCLFPDVRTGDAAGSALLFNMGEALRDGARTTHPACVSGARGWCPFCRISVGLQSPMKNLATLGFQLRPDITIQSGNESVAIIDAKWKCLDVRESNSGVSSGDAY